MLTIWGKKKIVEGEYVLKNLWNKEDVFQEDTQLVFVFFISRTGKNNYMPYIIFNRSIFSTPIWENTELPVSVVYGNGGKALVKEKCEKNADGDVVVLGTEAGIDMYSYWDNEEMKVCESDEEP